MDATRRSLMWAIPMLAAAEAFAADGKPLSSFATPYDQLPVKSNGKTTSRPILDGVTHSGDHLEPASHHLLFLWAVRFPDQQFIGTQRMIEFVAQVHEQIVQLLLFQEPRRVFDGALDAGEALMLPIPLDFTVLRAQARMGVLPALFSDLVHLSARPSSEEGRTLARRLATTPEVEREGMVLDLVRAQVATVLGHATSEAIDTRQTICGSTDLQNKLSRS